MAKQGRPRSERVTLPCSGEGCSNLVERYPVQVERSKTGLFFCSKACERKSGGRPRTGQWVECARDGCSTSFYQRPSSVSTCCSRSCAAVVRGYRGEKLQPRPCLHCTLQFRPVTRGQDYCGRTCAALARQTIFPRPCERCGKEFTPAPASAGRFCSNACRRTPREDRICEFCDATFAWLPGTNQGRFCSNACRWAARRTRALPRWHNGKPATLASSGYVMVWEPDHPAAMSTGWVLEHRMVAEASLGRRLLDGEHVHHVDRNRENNDPANLQVLAHEEHARITAKANAKRAKDYDMVEAERDAAVAEAEVLRARLALLEADKPDPYDTWDEEVAPTLAPPG